MKISFDAEVDAMYIRFVDEPFEVTTRRLSEDVAVNYAPDGRIIGVEILDTSSYVFRPGMEGQIEVENLTPIIYPSPSLYARNHRSAAAGTDRT